MKTEGKEWGGSESRGKNLFPPHELHKNVELSIIPPFKDPAFLHQKYHVEGLSIEEIATQIFSSTSAVHSHLRKFGIPLRKAATKSRNRLAYGEAWRGHKAVPHQRELENIEKMRDLRQQGFSYWKIADVLNSMKVPTKTRRGKWHARSVQQILDAADQRNSHRAPEPVPEAAI